MRDPKRIEPLLKKIEKIWLKCPDLRLGQLITTHFLTIEKLRLIEDDELEKILEEFLQ